jgi:hypothetical protein
MDQNEHLAEVRAELAGSKLTRAERADAEAQLRASASSAPSVAPAPDHPPRRQETGMRREAPTVEAAVAAVEDRAAAAAPGAATASESAPAATAPNAAVTPKNPIHDLVDRLVALESQIAATNDPDLMKRIQRLALAVQEGRDVGRQQDQFQLQLAYTLQDVERVLGPVPDLPAGLRNQMTLLATTLPGLHNERLQTLLRETPAIADRALVREIRAGAGRAVSSDFDQHSPAITRQVDELFDKVYPPAPAAAGAAQASAPATATGIGAAATQTSRQMQPQDGLVTHEATGPKALLSIFRGFRDPAGATREPWDPPPAPLGSRLAEFASRLGARNEERQLADAERSGRAALDALQEFNRGAGAGVLTRIRDAARNDPGGFPAVIAQMREGGKYAELRTQFNSALATEKGLGAAYDRAAVALGQYGAQRTAADTIITRRPDAAAINSRFEQIDADLGQAASVIPGRQDGKSALDEIAEKARQIMTRAVESIRSLFGRGATATATASASPGASPTP